MEKNQPWGEPGGGRDRTNLHYAYGTSIRRTLQRVSDSDPNGTHIYPKHVHKALRRYLGINELVWRRRRFPFNNTEDFPFFGSGDS